MNREAERQRLAELVLESDILCNTCGENSASYCAEAIADILLDDGVIVPPVKVGQKLYLISDGLYWETEVIRVVIRQGEGVDPCIVFVRLKDGNIKAILDIVSNIDNTVFLTREEAEKALKERETK